MNTATTSDYEQQAFENKQGIANLVNTARLIVREFDQTDGHTSYRETEPEWWLVYSDLARQASIILAKYGSRADEQREDDE